MSQTQKHPRRRKLIRPDIQFRVAAIAFGVAILVGVCNLQLDLLQLWAADAKFGDERFQEIVGTIWQNAGISFLLAAALSFSIGILGSFHFAGPVYKFRKYLLDLQNGRWDQPVRIRDRDHLGDVADAINGAVEGFRSRLTSSHEFHQEVNSLLESVERGENVDGQIASLRASIESEDVFYRERLGTQDSTQPQSTPASKAEPQETAALETA